jgi:hypothetical protein
MATDVKGIMLPHRFGAAKNTDHQLIFQTPVFAGKLMNKMRQAGAGIITIAIDGVFPPGWPGQGNMDDPSDFADR